MNDPNPVPLPGRGLAPNGAVSSGVFAGAAVVVLVWVIKVTTHLDMPDYVQDALVVLVGGLGMWAHPQGRVPKG